MRRLATRRRERYEWTSAISVVPTVVAVNTNNVIVLLTSAQLEEWPRGRIARILGQIFVSPATAPAVATGYGVFLGITLAPIDAAAASIAFDPEVDLDHRWRWWGSCFPQLGGTGAADSNASRWVGYFRFDLDVKRTGRYAADDRLQIALKNSASSGASVQYSFAFRILIAAGAR